MSENNNNNSPNNGILKLSYSSWSKYLGCGRKYYIDKRLGYAPKKLSSPLFFGSAVDLAVNRMLLDFKAGKLANVESYYLTFDRYWCKAKVTSRDMRISANEILDFKKTDMIESMLTEKDHARAQHPEHLTWLSMRRKAHKMIECYYRDALPEILEVIEVQKEFSLPNGEGDSLIGFIDLIAKLKDGKMYIVDNKTAAKKYTADQATVSPQLTNYANALGINDVAFFVLTKTKNPELQIVIGKIEEDSKSLLLDSMGQVVQAIKNDVFPANTNNCFQYGRCEYYDFCHKKDDSGLYIKVKK